MEKILKFSGYTLPLAKWCAVVGGIASVFMVNYLSIFPTDNRSNYFSPLLATVPSFCQSGKNNSVICISDIWNLSKVPTSHKYGGRYKQT